MSEPALATAGEALPDLDVATDQAIAACGGDARAAVKALLIMNNTLENELATTRLAVSFGYSRGWHRRRNDQ
ncbi:hypothetical protein [Mesorhizobium sp. J428]|uniref:hypothetical protein n=1 Tax=Mesorhizobium sp. J428 TaxID=2898440 RepID=UPI002150879E|nr:hypothetical protein [Mesorhizobium sp. J428]MCR5859748.1 hypothetical protein [Mesorhizobium sp. J428]